MIARRWAESAGAVALLTVLGCGARGSLLLDGATGTGGTTGAAGGTTTMAPPGPCQPGDAPVMLAEGEDGPAAIALDAYAVYYTIGAPAGCAALPRVKRVPKTGGAVTVVAEAMQRLDALAVDGATHTAFWSDDRISPCSTPIDPGYTLFAAPTQGGTPSSFPFPHQLDPAREIALDTGFVYWLVQEGGGVYFAPEGGGPATTLHDGSIYGLGLAVDPTGVYWTTEQGVLAAPKAGGATPVTLAPLAAADLARDLALGGGQVYFTGSTTCTGPCLGVGTLKQVSTSGGEVTTLATFQDQSVGAVAVGPTSVYLAATQIAGTPPAGSVIRVPRAGGAAETILPGKQPTALALDGSCVYWTDFADGSVWRAPL